MISTRNAAIITAHTGYFLGSFDNFHQYAEEILGRPIWTHEFGSREVANQLHDKSVIDFAGLRYDLTDEEKAIIWAFTGVSIGKPSVFREYAERLLEQETTMQELRDPATREVLHKLSHEDFLDLDVEDVL